MSRHVIAVDVESTGLRRGVDIAVEVAWHDLTTGERGAFVPCHDISWVLNQAEPRALEVNGYKDRLAHAVQDDGTEARRLFSVLDGNVLAGSNPSSDADWLETLFSETVEKDPSRVTPFRPWHHRMLDLSNYAAAILQFPPTDLPGLWAVCETLGIEPEPEVHTATNGCAVTAACFEALFEKAGVKA